MMQRLITLLALFFIYFTAAFCLWSIGTLLVEQPLQALLLFPFGLRLGILLQSPRGYWPGILLADTLLLWLLADQFDSLILLWTALPVLLFTTLLAVFASPWLLRHQQSDSEWQWPLMQGSVVAIAALIQALIWQLSTAQGAMALLLGQIGRAHV